MALTGSVNTANIPVPVRFGGPGSTSSERDCIIVGEFTPQTNKITVRLKGIGKNPQTGVDNRVYEKSNALGTVLDANIIGVVGRGEWKLLLDTQPEAALALHKGMGDDNNGDNYAACLCICESGEVRWRRQYQVENLNETLRDETEVQVPDTFYDAVADLGLSPELSADLVWTFELEKVAVGQTRFGQISTDNQDMLAIRVSVDWPYAPTGVKDFTAVVKADAAYAFNGNAYIFIGNPFGFWPVVEANAAMPGVQVLSVEYVDAQEPEVTYFNLFGTSSEYFVPLTDLRATDNVGVVAYMVSCPGAEPTEQPAADDERWSSVPPNFALVEQAVQVGSGEYIFYPWVKDAAGNINTVANAVASAYTSTLTIA